MEGRQCLSTRSFQVAVIPFAFGVCNSHFKNLLGEITRLHVDDFMQVNCLWVMKDEMELEPIRLWRAIVEHLLERSWMVHS